MSVLGVSCWRDEGTIAHLDGPSAKDRRRRGLVSGKQHVHALKSLKLSIKARKKMLSSLRT